MLSGGIATFEGERERSDIFSVDIIYTQWQRQRGLAQNPNDLAKRTKMKDANQTNYVFTFKHW